MMPSINHKQQQQQQQQRQRQHCGPQTVAAESHAIESQCETLYDEEEDDDGLTEDEDVEEDDDDDDSEETLTDVSSSPQGTKVATFQTRGACLSPDIQKLVSEMPEVSQHFRIVNKIGEGIFTVSRVASIPRSDWYRNI